VFSSASAGKCQDITSGQATTNSFHNRSITLLTSLSLDTAVCATDSVTKQTTKLSKIILKTPWSESASELYRKSDRSLSAKLVQNFADRGCRVVSATDPHGLDRSRYLFYQAVPQLYLRGLVDPVSDPLLLRKYGSAGNRTRTSGYVARNSDH
jgi:hypothetical protein